MPAAVAAVLVELGEGAGQRPPGGSWLFPGSLWGVVQVQSGLRRSGHQIGAGIIRRILRSHAIPPPAVRDDRWRTFPHAHAATILAADFFHTDCAVPLTRLHAAFVTGHDTRHVHLPGGLISEYQPAA